MMLKKILTAAVMTAIVCTLLTVGVSAAEYLNQDFENGIDVFEADTPPKGAARVEVNEDGNNVVFFDNTTESNLVNRIKASTKSLTNGGVMMFDFKYGQKGDKGHLYVELNGGVIDGVNAKCVLNMSALSHDADTWYSYIITMNKGCTEGMAYRKRRDVDEPYSFLVKTTVATTGEANAMWRMYCLKHSCYFDNIRIFDGVFVGDSAFMIDGEEVSKLSDVTGGVLSAKLNIVCGQVTKEEVGPGVVVAKGTEVTPVMVFFDKNMRMVNCTQVVEELAVGDNEVIIEVDTTNFADKLDGGFAGLYVLDDVMNIRPLSDAVELR